VNLGIWIYFCTCYWPCTRACWQVILYNCTPALPPTWCQSIY